MRQAQSIIVGAIFAAGLLLRPSLSFAPQASAPPNPEAVNADSELRPPEDLEGDGPWVTSCKYWSPGRQSQSPAAGEPSTLNMDLDETGSKLKTSLKIVSSNTRSECEGRTDIDAWGLPRAPAQRPKIQTVLALVPDPVHGHLTLQFDRTMDALMQAAADNYYFTSYYWLPWKPRAVKPQSSGSSADSESVQQARERQPGLIVFRHIPRGPDWSAKESFDRVMYVFLAGESPTLGVDGDQVQNAFSWQMQLQNCSKHVSVCDLSIIGPRYSGSAASLRKAVDTMPHYSPDVDVEIAGVTSTSFAAKELTARSPERQPPNLKRVPSIREYHSFDDAANFYRFLNLLSQSNLKQKRVAILDESGTAYGATFGATFGATVASPNLQDHKADESSGRRPDEPLYIRFPRQISLLRNAYTGEKDQATSSSSAPSPYLHMSLRDSETEDSVPHFSQEKTPLSGSGANGHRRSA